MALYLAMSGIEVLDRRGFADDGSALAETAATLRNARSGDDPLGLGDEVRRARTALRRLADGLGDATDALD